MIDNILLTSKFSQIRLYSEAGIIAKWHSLRATISESKGYL